MKGMARFWLFIAVTCTIFLIFAFPFQKMGIDSHFFEVLYQLKTVDSWSAIWSTESIQSYYPLNEIISDSPYIYFYRPILQSLHALELHLFGNWWLGYIFCSLLFFALTAGVLAVVFSYFYSFLDAIILIALYVVHPALSPAFLSITALFSAAYFLLALSLLCFIWYSQKRESIFYILSLFLYLASILTYECLIIATPLLCLFWFLFNYLKWYEILPFFCLTGAWIGVRFLLIGTSHSLQFSLSSYVQAASMNFMQMLKPFWGLGYSSPLVALSISMLFCVWVGYHYLHEKKDRRLILWLVLSFIITMAVFLLSGSAIIFCLGLPFFVLLIHLLLSHVFSNRSAQYLLLCIILFSGLRTFENFVNREQFTNARDIALHEVLSHYPSKKYIFLIAPHECKHQTFLLSSGLEQALRFLSQDDDLMLYYFQKVSLCTNSFPSEGMIEVYTIDEGYRLQVTDPKRIWFSVPHDIQKIEGALGSVFINHRISSCKATDISIFLKSEYRKKEFIDTVVIFSWDPSMWKFVPVEKEHLVKI
ncbi:hypothetical protein JKY79_02865 [Candidatus Babeliales bacterium]|nr:hypothetical protein [Candidatus Babeliales bacterium]